MAKRGLAERRPDHARACRIVLTTEGREAQRRLGHAYARHVTSVMTRALTRQQLQPLRELSRALVTATPATAGHHTKTSATDTA